MADEPSRALLYERISVHVTGAEARSVEEQHADNTRACQRYGWTATERYADPGRSASRFATKRREEWERLVTDVEAGRGDVVIMWESSRGGREMVDWSKFLSTCRACGVLIYVTNDDKLYDVRKARDWRTLTEDGVDAAYESEKTSGRVRRGLASNAAKGRPHSNIPLGYEREYHPKTRELVAQKLNPETAWIPREIITRVADGDSISAIARDLRRREVPTPKGGDWIAARIRQVARNPVYIGKVQSQGEWIEAIWPGLVDEATFWSAQRVLTDPVRKITRPGAAKHLLSYLAVCGKCGKPLSVSTSRGAHPMLICHMTGCTGLREDWADRYITGLIVARLSDPVTYARLTGGAGDTEVLAARAEAEELRRRRREAADAFKGGKISIEAFSLVDSGLTASIAEADRRAEQAALPPVLRNLDPKADILEQFQAAPLAARKAIVRRLFASIRVEPATRRGRVTRFDPERVSFEWRRPG